MLVEDDPDPAFRQVTFSWAGDGAADVFVRLNTVSYQHHLDGDLSPLLMTRHDDGVWRLTLRLPADHRGTYMFCPSPVPLAGRRLSDAEWQALNAAATGDPAHPDTLGPLPYDQTVRPVLALPAAPPQPWLAPRPGVPTGTLTEQLHHSVEFGTARRLWTYSPPGYADLADLPLVLLLDGDDWSHCGLPAILDNLIAEGAVPPAVVVMIDALDTGTRTAEMTDHPRYLRFLLDEVVPWASGQWRVTTDPARTVVAGQSFGGLMAAYAGLHAPHRFGLVLTQSGSFWWPDSGGGDPDFANRPLLRGFAAAGRLPLRIYQDVGLIEQPRLLGSNRHLRDVLLAKGYPLDYREYQGGHDLACWRASLPTALISLLTP
ncbi:enterochelin esterase [Catellatospora sp. KI3]|uniref:enterochelin esterase n=1 Tax=Catellatospora sp. KI3 TaxID=3041620 RepID=UPI002483037C|nr:enterochelin esterase [Catellatospora sp. KI3]MDI1463176.1 enterochelin esterase [Catellatospora sp. KI3]